MTFYLDRNSIFFSENVFSSLEIQGKKESLHFLGLCCQVLQLEPSCSLCIEAIAPHGRYLLQKVKDSSI
jgi:hypothetical protein